MSDEFEGLDTVQVVGSLAAITKRLGALHEFQLKNLKIWPLAIFSATNSTCEYHHKTRTLFFTLEDDGKAIYSEEGYKQLEEYCKYLLGADVAVAIRTESPPRVIYGKDRFSSYPTDE